MEVSPDAGSARARPGRGTGILLLAAALLFAAGPACAQDLEPRRWSHLPIGLNVLGLGAGTTDGEIFLDPVLQIDDGEVEYFSFGASYVRAFEWLGRSNRIDVRLPYARGRWEGSRAGEPISTRRHGFADPSLRWSIALYGAPPLSGREWQAYRAANPVTTTVGAAITVVLPWGEYFPDRLINLGSNRYIVRTQLGVLHQRHEWQFELTGSMSWYEDNDDYFGGRLLERDPLAFLQGHLIRDLGKGRWISASGGYSWGGETAVDGNLSNNNDRTRFFALGYGFPLSPRQAMKITLVHADTNINVGARTNSLLLGWSVSWAD
ncbi:MAG: transporter [Xanthomonadales bacterium]|nr:transporter [Xanthomonadales bacterium]